MLMLASKHIPDFLKNEKFRLILFGGKGGVGKTTMAATTALSLAESSPNQRKILIISTDPAHSLSDSFGIEIGDRVTLIKGAGNNLFAHELDAARLLAGFKEENHDVIRKLVERGTYFDGEDIADFFDLSLPGMDEIMAIMEMSRLLKEHAFDVIIVDTAPTGHTLRMLDLPRQMNKWIDVMDLMQHKHRYMFRKFTGKKYVKDECDLFLDRLSSDVNRVLDLLTNRDETRFVPVVIPEPMSIDETKRLVASLEKIHVPVKEVVVNRVAENDGCRFCRSQKEDQKEPLMAIDQEFSAYGRVRVPLFASEIRGMAGLKRTADYLLCIPLPSAPFTTLPAVQESRACLSLDPNLEFIFFGGKGGVGKTSLASAAGLHLAQRYPGRKILVFSTDPAHSLSDCFNIQIGDTLTPIGGSGNADRGAENGNLFALEIDADRLWADFKDAFQKDIKEMFNKFLSRGAHIKFDGEVMTQLLELAPPGLDEMMSLDKIMDLKKAGAFDIFVLDTSPTGHLLRFLELPQLVRQWLKAFFTLLIKYKGTVRLTGAAEKALSLSRNVRMIQETLADPQKTDFVAVTIPEHMGFMELERLMNALQDANLPCHHIIVNMVLPRTDCGFCSHKRTAQQDCLKKIHSRFHSQTLVQAPRLPHSLNGTAHLKIISETVFCRKQV